MYKHIAESFVVVRYAPNVAEKISAKIEGFCQSILSEGSERFLSFEDGCVVILPTDKGLFFRVSARDLVVFHGIQTLIEGSLSTFATVSAERIKWLKADVGARSPANGFESIGYRAADNEAGMDQDL